MNLICDACHIETRVSLHDLIYGNGKHDAVGALVCATAYYVHHALKLGNKPLLNRALLTDNFAPLRASAHSSAKTFWNEFGIQAFRVQNPRNTSGLSIANAVIGSDSHTVFNELLI